MLLGCQTIPKCITINQPRHPTPTGPYPLTESQILTIHNNNNDTDNNTHIPVMIIQECFAHASGKEHTISSSD